MHVPQRILAVALIGIAFLGAINVIPVVAQEDYTTRLGLTLGGSLGKYGGGDLDHLEVGSLFHGGLRLGWKRNWDLEVRLRYGSFLAVELPDSTGVAPNSQVIGEIRNQSTGLDAGVLYTWKPEERWSPQAFGGAGLLSWQVVDLGGVASSGSFGDGPTLRGLKDDGHPEFLTNTNLVLYGGVGAEIQVLSTTFLRVGARLDYLVSQDIDNSGASAVFGAQSDQHVDSNQWLGSTFVGLTYFFSKRDSDQDGIPNKQDPCPYDAEDLDGFEDGDGCPDVDNDGDGILDVDDASPDEPEDMDGFEDEDGAPDPDNDGDGILDADDAAPNDAEDLDGFEDGDGVPDLDNDQDGVLDTADQCDGTPAGVPVDSLGCPTAVLIDSALTLSRVAFLPNSADLDSISFVALDSIVSSLMAFSDLEIEIQVHTNNQGPENRNLIQSQTQAEAIAQYFIQQGVAARRLTPVGYGESTPLVANDTSENRAINARIVIVPLQTMDLDSLDDLDELDEDLEIDLSPDNDLDE